MKKPNYLKRIPSPELLRRRLDVALQEAAAIRKILRISEAVERKQRAVKQSREGAS